MHVDSRSYQPSSQGTGFWSKSHHVAESMQVFAAQAVVVVSLVAGSGAGGVQGLLPDVVLVQMKSAGGVGGDRQRRLGVCDRPWGAMWRQAAVQAAAGLRPYNPIALGQGRPAARLLTSRADNHCLVLAVGRGIHTCIVGSLTLGGFDDVCGRVQWVGRCRVGRRNMQQLWRVVVGWTATQVVGSPRQRRGTTGRPHL